MPNLLALPKWLLLAFCPKILGGDIDLQVMVLFRNECGLSGENNHRWCGHSILICRWKKLNFLHSQGQWVTWWNYHYLICEYVILCYWWNSFFDHIWHSRVMPYRSGTVNSNTVNSKFHLIRSFFEIFARFLSFHV